MFGASNKTRRVIRATKDTNGHPTIGAAEAGRGPACVGAFRLAHVDQRDAIIRSRLVGCDRWG